MVLRLCGDLCFWYCLDLVTATPFVRRHPFSRGILYLPTCVGFGYRYPFVEGRSSFSWDYDIGYFSVVTLGTRTLARGRSGFSWDYDIGYFSVVTLGTRTLARGCQGLNSQGQGCVHVPQCLFYFLIPGPWMWDIYHFNF
ncbi:hypothetical protein POM88_054584 [Heracleum sosnowskyi]|uniref:Secreted protein n=1 Tax=Heracleum sosnowskyi TaxID=360622 RepID=A0AAD8GMT1_9APIA|nr:hypothetical protein POM88_054584 [Heracleum sosnowskyi]